PDNAAIKAVVWSSNDNNVATVDQSGLVTGIKEGNAAITATVKGTSVKAEAAITVKKPADPTGPTGPESPSGTTPPPAANTGVTDIEKDTKITKETTSDGKTVTKVTVNADKLEKALMAPIVLIEVKGSEPIV